MTYTDQLALLDAIENFSVPIYSTHHTFLDDSHQKRLFL